MRKTSKDYQKEYNEMLKKQKGLESRIKNRAKEMCERQPNVIVAYQADDNRTPIKSLDFFKELNQQEKDQFYTRGEYITKMYLYIIETIEQHNEKKGNIKQLKMFE